MSSTGGGHMPRDVERCPHRRLSTESRPDGAAFCSILETLLGAECVASSEVRRDVCKACCRSFPPSPENPNPVVSSLLYQRSSQIAASGGVAGCSRSRAETLMKFAEENLPFDFDVADSRLGKGVHSKARPECLDDVLPLPARSAGPRIRRWAVGVTTAPREVPTLSDCLVSLVRAGWETPRVFIDGAAEIPERFAHLPQTLRSPRMGAWPSYYLSLAELLMREPSADGYMLVQDDALFSDLAGVREHLERVLWPGERPGIASLFCSRAYTLPRPGWHEFTGTWRWCALAFVFSRAAAQRFLADVDVVRHRWSRHRNGLADISWRIGKWARSAGVPVYYPTPSIVQHIGDVSTLWQGARLFGNRRASSFACK